MYASGDHVIMQVQEASSQLGPLPMQDQDQDRTLLLDGADVSSTASRHVCGFGSLKLPMGAFIVLACGFDIVLRTRAGL